MQVQFTNNGKILMDDVKILWPNFAGARGKYNQEGDRNFKVVVDDQNIADALMERGCNLKIREPEEPGDLPFMFFEVKVSYRFDPPVVRLVSGRSVRFLDEETIGTLDRVDILRVDLDIHFGREWTQNGTTARTAYLDKIVVVQEVDRFAARYAEEEYPGEAPWN